MACKRPLYDLHVDLWYPGDFIDYTGSHYLLNYMCDLTQFVVVVPVPGITASIIAKYFMQEVLLKFGLCHLEVMDDGTPFKGVLCWLVIPFS